MPWDVIPMVGLSFPQPIEGRSIMEKYYCPVCGTEIRANKGWAAKFYDGYCNRCDMPVEDAVFPDDEEGEEDDV